MKKKTTEEFKIEVFNKVGNEYKVLGEYKSNKDKILIRHNTCGHEYEVTPVKFLSGRRCPNCSKNKKKDTKWFKNKVNEILGNEYTVLGEYINTNTKIKMYHNTCGHEYEVKPSTFLNKKTKCPYCYGTPKKTTEEFKTEVFNKVGNEYKVLGEYKSNKDKIEFIHIKCNNKFEMRPGNFLNSGNRCPFCSGKAKKDTKIFSKEISKITNNEYELVSEYINNSSKVSIKHLKCGRIFEMKPTDFLYGHRCPKCNSDKYKNENEIEEILKELGLKYEREVKIGCTHIRELPFDFKIWINDTKFILLEYDGEFHYKPIYGEEYLKKQKENDKIKDDFCKENNITLLRISYLEKENKKEIIKRSTTSA